MILRRHHFPVLQLQMGMPLLTTNPASFRVTANKKKQEGPIELIGMLKKTASFIFYAALNSVIV
jgi:hypothetical protein